MKRKHLLLAARLLLWPALVGWTAFGLWNGLRGTLELMALKNSGKTVEAQVTGYEPVPRSDNVGYVHYAIHVSGGAIDNRFAHPIAKYGEYPIGSHLTVTYLPEHPHTMRLGTVDTGRIMSTAFFGALFVVLGLSAFGLPLFAIATLVRKERDAQAA
jgi:Protein of unknown function (DUF3592)